jgi:hypothetical protein
LVRQNPSKNNPKNRANPWAKREKSKSERFGPRIIGIGGILEEEQILVRQNPF